MESFVDYTVLAIARCLQRERAARGWSLAELAERSTVSKAALSKIERGEMSPTATVLVKIAGALDLTLAGFLLRAEGGGERLTRAADQPVWHDPATGYRRRQVFVHADHPVEIVEVTMPPGQQVTMPASSYRRIRQALWVTAGRLVLIEGAVRHELAEGDCLGFGPPAEVVFANETSSPCTYLVVIARS